VILQDARGLLEKLEESRFRAVSLGVVFEGPVDELTVRFQRIVVFVFESNFYVDS
jgi:hypothetical protein